MTTDAELNFPPLEIVCDEDGSVSVDGAPIGTVAASADGGWTSTDTNGDERGHHNRLSAIAHLLVHYADDWP